MIRDAKRRLSLPVDDSAGASHAAQINYAGCIVSFLGAVHWGLALGDGGARVVLGKGSVNAKKLGLPRLQNHRR